METTGFITRRTYIIGLVLFSFFSNYAQTIFYSKAAGNLDAKTTWTNSLGAAPTSFTANNQVFVIKNRATATIAASWTVSGTGSKVQVGDGATAVSFTIPTTFSYVGTIDVTNTATLSIQNTTIPTFGIISSGSTIDYSRAGNQSVTNTTYYNLTLSGSGRKALLNTANTTVTNILNINSGVRLTLNTVTTQTCIISGSVTGTGTITAGGNSNLSITGSGALGTIIFGNTVASSTLYQFSVNRTGSGSIVLGSNLTVANAFMHTNGKINLNGKLLTLNNTATFPVAVTNGAFVGSTTSSLSIATPTGGVLTNSMFMDQTSATTKSMSSLILNRTGQTLTLGNDLIVTGNLTQTVGKISIATSSLSLNGVVTFATPIANGAIIGSSTSSLSIGGAGAITNPLLMDQTSNATKTINNFTYNRTGVNLSLGNNLISDGQFAHNNGTITVGTTSLTLNGAITFPVAATNGLFTGSATSSLSIGGTGAITNSMFMAQTSAATKTFNNFLFNRASQTATLGNNLIVNVFNHTNGKIAIGTTSLTINGITTFPVAAANGAFVGSTTSSLSIATPAGGALTNSMFMDQTSATTKSMSSLTLNRTGQTLTLGNDLIVTGNLTQTVGKISIATSSLSLNGVVTFATPIANGAIIGSSTSSLSIGGAGAITNPLLMDQTSNATKTINNFTYNRTGVNLSLGNNLISDGQFAHNNGTVTVGTTSLTLNGAITFPVAATNGLFTGSATSSLSIGGTGAITNSMFMAQTSAATKTFNNFLFNRASQTATLGNNLIVNVFNHTNGKIAIGTTSLTINGITTFPVAAANGAFVGSTTSSLSIVTPAGGNITNSMFMDQTSAATRSLFDLTLNRTARTLTIGNSLEIINSITPTAGTIALGGNVTLKNSATSKSRLGVVGGGVTGNLIVENFIPAGSAGWVILGPPGISGLKVSNWDGGSGSSTDFAMTCSGCTYGANSAGGHFVSIQGDAAGTDATFQELTSADNLTPGTGYWVYDASSTTARTAVTQTKTGPVVTGPVSSTSAFASNPYPSPLSLSALQTSNPGLGSIKWYDAASMNYIVVNGGIPTNIIPMGQGFYASGVGSVNFHETDKDVTSKTDTRSIQRSSTVNKTASTIGSVFQLKIDGFLGDYDNTYIRLHPDATWGFDLLLDGYKTYTSPGYLGTGATYSQYTSIGTVMANQDYQINSLPDTFASNIVIPVITRVQVTGQYTISPIDIQNLPINACVSLKDKLLNITHDLRTGPYVCNIADTTTKPRFELTICASPQVVTSIQQYASTNNVLIGQDVASGVFIKTKFDKSTKSVISAYNVMGQKIIADKEINNAEDLVYLNFNDLHNQIVIIKVSNDKGQTTKKVFIN